MSEAYQPNAGECNTPPPSQSHRLWIDARDVEVLGMNQEERARREMAANDTSDRLVTVPLGNFYRMALPTLGSEDEEENHQHNGNHQGQLQPTNAPSSIGMEMLSISSPRTPKSSPPPQQENQQDQEQEQERPSVFRWRNGPPRLQRKVRRKSNDGMYIAPSLQQLHEPTGFQTPKYQYIKAPLFTSTTNNEDAPPTLRKRKSLESLSSPTDVSAAKENDCGINGQCTTTVTTTHQNKLELPKVSLKRKYASSSSDDEGGRHQEDHHQDLPFFPSDLPDVFLPPTQVFGGTNLKPVFDSTLNTTTANAADNNGNSNSNNGNMTPKQNKSQRRGPLMGVNLIAPRPKKRMDTLLIF